MKAVNLYYKICTIVADWRNPEHLCPGRPVRQPARAHWLVAMMLFSLTLAGCGDKQNTPPPPTATIPEAQIEMDDPRFPIEPALAGKELYEANCGACHGVNGEGQPPDPGGLIVAPPHDGSGHTWHHPDQANFLLAHNGRHMDGANEMPGFGGKLAQDDIFSILAYIKTFWNEEQQASQRDLTLQAASNG